MTAKPLVSVVICAYNYGRYVGQAIDSALAQRWPADRLEVIVVDDGSTDHTPEVIARYGDRVRSIRQENAGVLAATSTGILAARGELVATLDADDRWLPFAIPTLAAALRREPDAGLVMGDLRVVDDAGQVQAASYRKIAAMIDGFGHYRGDLVDTCRVNTNAMMFRRELILPALPFDTLCPYQDWWIALELSRVCAFTAVPDVIALYRNHDANFVLGSDLVAAARRELRFRRRLLTTREQLTDVGPTALQRALQTFDGRIMTLMHADPDAVAPLVPVTSADRDAAAQAMQAASAALDDARLHDAAIALTIAGAHDPYADDPRQLLSQLVAVADVPVAA